MTHNIKPDYLSIDTAQVSEEQYRALVAFMIEKGITWAWSTRVTADSIYFEAKAPDCYGNYPDEKNRAKFTETGQAYFEDKDGAKGYQPTEIMIIKGIKAFGDKYKFLGWYNSVCPYLKEKPCHLPEATVLKILGAYLPPKNPPKLPFKPVA